MGLALEADLLARIVAACRTIQNLPGVLVRVRQNTVPC